MPIHSTGIPPEDIRTPSNWFFPEDAADGPCTCPACRPHVEIPRRSACGHCGRTDCPGRDSTSTSYYGSQRDCTYCTYCQTVAPERHAPCRNCGRCDQWCRANRCTECQYCYCSGPCEDCGGCSCEGPCSYCDTCGCEGPCGYCHTCGCQGTCDEHPDRWNGTIHGYSYKPRPVFYGTGPLFMGMELEVETPNTGKSLSVVTDTLGDLAYVKEDSSIRHGFEIVTHPMDWSYVDTQFPWRVLPDLRATGAQVNPDENGLHVHLSRSGFDGPCHVFRWMKLLHRNRSRVSVLARRDSDQWAAWNRSTRRMTKFIAKPELQHNRFITRDQREFLRYNGFTRYEAINTTNAATFELRMFASSLDSQEVAAALAFASSSVEYARILTPQDILKKDGWNWRGYSEFVAQTPSYAPLHKELTKLCVS